MGKAFQLKHFKIQQDYSTHKVGTDSFILGAITGKKEAKNILDIGTGTGILALIMAQKHEKAFVDAVELDNSTAKEALSNFLNSPFSDRLKIYHKDFNEFDTDKKYSEKEIQGFLKLLEIFLSPAARLE